MPVVCVVVGAKEVVVTSAERLLSVIEMGNALLRTASSGMNEYSSRSHAILTLQVTLSAPDKTDPLLTSVRSSKLCLVDLAGSESASKAENTGARFDESSYINTDLLTLENVIRCLSDPRQKRRGVHIPCRDSKLTRLLRSSLGGTAHTLMVAWVSPSNHFVVETLVVLQFASKVHHIHNHPRLIALQTETKLVSTSRHQSDVWLGEMEYELQTLRELLKEKEKELDMAKEKIAEKGDSVKLSSLPDVSEPDKVKIPEERSQYRLLAQEAAVFLAEVSGSSSSLSMRQRVQNWQERLTACLAMPGAPRKLDNFQIHVGPQASSLERVLATFKMRGHLLLAEEDEKEEVFCPLTQQCAKSKNEDPVTSEFHLEILSLNVMSGPQWTEGSTQGIVGNASQDFVWPLLHTTLVSEVGSGWNSKSMNVFLKTQHANPNPNPVPLTRLPLCGATYCNKDILRSTIPPSSVLLFQPRNWTPSRD